MLPEESTDVADALFRVGIDSNGAGEFISVTATKCVGNGRIEVDPDEAESLLDMIAQAHNAIVDNEVETKGSD
jgi:DNA-binding protein YbaB